MLAFLLVVGVVMGIAYPFARRRWFARELVLSEAGPREEQAEVTSNHRGELCPSCSSLNPNGRRLCVECGGAMPVSSMVNLWQGTERQNVIREGVQTGILLVAMLIAMALANGLPIAGKVVILMATIAGLCYRFLHGLTE